MTRPAATTPAAVGLALLVLAGGLVGTGLGTAGEIGGGSARSGGLTAADGYLGDGTVGLEDDDRPAISNLDPALLAAVRDAASDARARGVRFRVTSGWRSRAYQQHLLDEAVAEHGSHAAARRWVKTPDGSTHVTGEAIDIGPTDAAYWLSRHGSDYGLCQIYANEIWHYELRTTPGGRCPAMHPDSSS